MSNINELIKNGISQNKNINDIFVESNNTINKIDFYKTVLNLIEAKEIPNILVCYCGHDCSKCLTFRATLNDDDDARRKIAGYYKSEFKQDIPIEKFYCLSGRSDTIMEGCLQCPYMNCSREKSLKACSECEQYPCQKLGWFIDKYVNKANQI